MAEEMAEILTHTADVLDGVTDKSSADLAATALAPLKERAKAIEAATSGMEKILQRLEANDFYGSEALKQFMLEN